MANYYGAARTNYFRVKDPEAFEAWASKYQVEVIKNADGLFGLLSDCPDSGSWPSSYFDEEKDDYVEIDIMQEVSAMLEDGEVAIFMETGAEKLRYLVGYAVAVNNRGETETISLQDIYSKAKKLGTNITVAEY